MNSLVNDYSAISAQEKSDAIAEIWKKILETDEVGTQQEFFDLGGNSMLLLAMLEVMQEKFDKEIALEDLADGVTIERLVGLLQ